MTCDVEERIAEGGERGGDEPRLGDAAHVNGGDVVEAGCGVDGASPLLCPGSAAHAAAGIPSTQ